MVHDHVRGEVSFESDGIGDFVIARPDGIPTYNFAVTVDDILWGLPMLSVGKSTFPIPPRQLMVYEAFGMEAPDFAHVSLILNPNRQKMSKRDESIIQFVEQYKEMGYLPEALVNFLVLLGWSPEGEEEIFTKEELIQRFTLDRVSKSPAVFDVDKLNWMNNHYIKETPLEKIAALSIPHLQKAGLLPEDLSPEQKEWATQVVGLYQEQMAYGEQIVELAELFFAEQLQYNDEEKQILAEEQVPEVLKAFHGELVPSGRVCSRSN